MIGAWRGGPVRWLSGAIALACTAGLLGPADAFTGTSHEVRRSETLSAIARRYGVSVRELVSANRLKGPRAPLQVGSRLSIPDGRNEPRVERTPRATARSGRAARRSSLRATTVRDVPAVPPTNVLLGIPELSAAAPEFAWPVDGAVSSNFGRRWRAWHRGVDIVATEGAPIYAAAAGVVIASGIEPRYGRVVKIEHDHGFVTVYAHNLANSVEVGHRVAAGQEIGNVGQTGRATSAHLHFEIRHEGRAVNPLYLLPLPPRVATEEFAVEPEDDDD